MDTSPELRIGRKKALRGLGLGLTAVWLLAALGFAQTVSSTKSLLARLAAGKAAGLKAGFSCAPAFPIQGQSVQFTDTSTGSPTFWHWDFGDGVGSTHQSPAHIYRRSGFMKVTLTVTKGTHSKKTTKTISVLKEAASATFLFSPTTPGPGQAVQFKDMTAGGPTSWKWDFGDGTTSTVQNPSHTFAKESIYTVTLVAGTAAGSKKGSRAITVAAVSILSASFVYAPGSPNVGQSVQFTDTSPGSPTSWSWTFGDGATSASRNPSHVYRSAGSYNVVLKVSNSSASRTANLTVNVGSAPTAAFTYSPLFPDVGQDVQFTDLSTGNPTSWLWSFNDGATSTERNPSHAFATAGTYNVSLTVSGTTGSHTASQSVVAGSGGISSGAYWASPTGTASWANARSETPLAGAACCSLATANANVAAGDTVYLRGGTYSTSIRPAHSGTRDRRITYRAYAGETPLFVIDTDLKGRWAVELTARSYVSVIGITSRGSLAFFWIGYGACYNEIAYCHFDRSSFLYSLGLISFYGTGLLGEGPGSDHNWIHHNVFSRYGSISNRNDNGTVRISGDRADPSSHNTFEDNVFFYGGHDNLDVGGRYNVVRNNVFHNEEAYFADTTKDCENRPLSGYFGNRCIHVSNAGDGPGTAYHTLIEGNRIGYAGTPPDDDGSCGIENAGAHTIARYNDIYGNGGMGYYGKMQAVYESSVRSGSWARVYNNTIYRNGFGDPSLDVQFKHGVCIWSYRTYNDWPENVVVKNNIVYDNYNEWRVGSDNILPQVVYENNYNSDPGFVNSSLADKTSLTLPDLRLSSGSPCVDGGGHLTQAKGNGSGSHTLVVSDALLFQDGTWGSSLTHSVTHFPDWIAIGAVENSVKIVAIDYATRTITLADPMTWTDNAKVWLFSDSGGRRVLRGAAPDFGAHEVER